MTAPLQYQMTPALEKAAIEKMKAETRLSELSAAGMQLELAAADLKLADARAELRMSEARAVEAEHEAETARIATALNARQEAYTLAQEHYHHTMTFGAAVTEKSVASALTQLHVWDVQDGKCPMNIIINSPGGEAMPGLHLFDQLTAYSLRAGGTHKVTVTVRGRAASMAGILLQAADVRRIGPESWLMIHEISAGTGGKVGEMKDDLKWFELMCDRIANVFLERSGGKITAGQFHEGWTDRNWWLPSSTALQLGFVDEIG